ncbi:MAG: hypothetical protein PVI86_01705 [Phycisphaerae bacterium]|jgi:hypothetical protein
MKYGAYFGVGAALAVAVTMSVRGDEPSRSTPTAPHSRPPTELPNLFALDARRAVREGNRLLGEGKPDAALKAYEHAKTLRPDAREIDFVEGLAHYENKAYEEARDAFRKVSTSELGALALSAIYSLGTCDHAEALDSVERDPQVALGLLESAMKRYHQALADQPTYRAAREANHKAVFLWRELKRRLQQQQQDQRHSDQKGDDPQEQYEDDDQRSDDSEETEQQESRSSESDRQEARQKPSAQSEAQREQARDQQTAKADEQASREQAERRLRQMMEAQRLRKTMRRRPVQRLPVTTVEKDW